MCKRAVLNEASSEARSSVTCSCCFALEEGGAGREGGGGGVGVLICCNKVSKSHCGLER